MTERPRPLPPLLTGLSARLLILTVAFVMLAELLIYTPSIAKYRMDWLQGRIAAARLVSLALDATPDYMVSEAVKAELLAHAEAYAIVIQKPGDVRRVLAGDMPPRADARFDLRGDGMMDMIGPVREAFMTLLGPGTRTLHVIGDSPRGDGVVVEVFPHRGEWMQPGDPLARVVRADTLRVEGYVDSKRHDPEAVRDRPVTVEIDDGTMAAVTWVEKADGQQARRALRTDELVVVSNQGELEDGSRVQAQDAAR